MPKPIILKQEDLDFLRDYGSLPEDMKRLARYVVAIGASNIFSEEEFEDFLQLLIKSGSKNPPP